MSRKKQRQARGSGRQRSTRGRQRAAPAADKGHRPQPAVTPKPSTSPRSPHEAQTNIALLRNFPYIHLLFGIAICLAVYEIILGHVNVDEVEGLHTAWKLFNGENIYRDFFQHHHPLLYYLLIPVIVIGGETIFTFYLAELFAAALWAVSVVITYKIAEKVYGDRKIALFSIVLLLVFPWFIDHGTQLRPDTLQIPLGLLSFYYLVLALEVGPENRSDNWLGKRKRRYLLLSALLLSLSFLALQKAMFLIFPVGLILLYRLFFASGGARMTMRDFLLYWAVFSLLPVLYVLYLLMVGDFQNYFDFNWLLNMKLIRHFPVLDGVLENPYVSWGMAGLAVLFIAGCFVRLPGNASAHWAAVLAGVCLIASPFLVRTPHPQYFLMAMPFVSIVAAASLRHFLPGVVTGLILSVLLYLCGNHLYESTRDGAFKRYEISIMRHVLEVTGPEDAYFGHRIFNLFRRDVDFFWFCYTRQECLQTYQGFREYDWDPLEIIEQTRPKVIGLRFPPSWTKLDPQLLEQARHGPIDVKPEVLFASLVTHPAIAPHYERSPSHALIYTRKEASSK